ncbi:MAG: cell division protein FtsQ, partial [Ruminococcus sp.]|nr:cell division protein FtsQ [Ruminococcus sp.]
MKDVEKTNVERRNSGKRMRRRRRNMNLYAVVVIALVLTIGITMSYTFLFNIEEVHISNISERYDENQIFGASGVSIGDNLLR